MNIAEARELVRKTNCTGQPFVVFDDRNGGHSRGGNYSDDSNDPGAIFCRKILKDLCVFSGGKECPDGLKP